MEAVAGFQSKAGAAAKAAVAAAAAAARQFFLFFPELSLSARLSAAPHYRALAAHEKSSETANTPTCTSMGSISGQKVGKGLAEVPLIRIPCKQSNV